MKLNNSGMESLYNVVLTHIQDPNFKDKQKLLEQNKIFIKRNYKDLNEEEKSTLINIKNKIDEFDIYEHLINIIINLYLLKLIKRIS